MSSSEHRDARVINTGHKEEIETGREGVLLGFGEADEAERTSQPEAFCEFALRRSRKPSEL